MNGHIKRKQIPPRVEVWWEHSCTASEEPDVLFSTAVDPLDLALLRRLRSTFAQTPPGPERDAPRRKALLTTIARLTRLCLTAAGLAVLLASGCGDAAPSPQVRDASAGTVPANDVVTAPPSEPLPRHTVEGPSETAAQPEPPDAPAERVYRPDDARPQHDDARAAELGIQRYESRRLLLYADIDPEAARQLPPLMDRAFDALEAYFGPMPPARDGAAYQMTGYIMAERDRFLAAGMLPEQALESLVHGVHRGQEFWMNEQEYDYYRRHLLIHEGTHCFMMVQPGHRPPVWYLEGMAEYFGTHRPNEEGVEFGVMPHDRERFVGFGRIEMIREAVEEGRLLSVTEVVRLTDADFVASRTEPYAWSWALCKFLDQHPRYRERFRQLAPHLVGYDFDRLHHELFAPDLPILAVEWELFVRNIEYGYDIPRAAIDFLRGEPLPPGAAIAADVRADAGWQASGIWVEEGQPYELQADGEVVLAGQPKPWISQPHGISIRYSQGKPIGRLVAAIQSESPPGPNGEGALWHVIDVGTESVVTPPASGTLYLRVNDFWSELSDNTGEYRVTVRAAE